MQKSPLRIAVNNLTPEQKKAEATADRLIAKWKVTPLYKLPKNKNHDTNNNSNKRNIRG
jgi:hypothetical protein